MNFAKCIERRYSGISRQNLQRHIRFCCRVLSADSSAHVILSNSSRIPIWKRKFRTKPDCLELQISAGHLGRMVVEKAAADIEAKGIHFKRKFTPKRGVLTRIITSHEIDDIFTPRIIADIIISVGRLVDPDAINCSMEYQCKFEDGCTVQQGDPVTFGKAYTLGQTLGRAAGVAARLFKKDMN